MNVHISDRLQKTLFDVKRVACWSCRPTNRYRTEIMYVYYIYMEIYVFCLHKYFFTFLFFMYNYHVIIIILSWIYTLTTQKPLKIKISISFHNFILWNFIFIQQFVLIKWKCFQKSQTHTYLLTKRKLNKKCFSVYTSHGSSCDSICN